jgi:hypothetical protein
VRQPEQKAAFVADVVQRFGLSGELDEQFLEQVARVRLVSGQVEEKGEQSLGVVVVQTLKLTVLWHVFSSMTRAKAGFV